MKNYSNPKKDRFLASIPLASMESYDDRLTEGCKFNFSYFDVQPAGQHFGDWSHAQLVGLLEKLKEYSKKPLSAWLTTPVGKSGTVLAIYGAFPKDSDFTVPKHVPHQAMWGRFRLESAVRLVGFVVPGEFHDRAHPRTRCRFDCNTFYVVFLDENHVFYKSSGEDK